MTITQPHRAAADTSGVSSRAGTEEVIHPLPGSLSGPPLFDDLPQGLHVDDADVSFGPERGQRDELTIHGPGGFINLCAQDGSHWIEVVAPAHHDLGLHEPHAVRVDLGAAADRLGVPASNLAPLLERAGTALLQARAELDGNFRPNRPRQQETKMTEQHIDAASAGPGKRIGDSIASENAAEVFNDWNIRKASGQRVMVGARSFDKGASWVNLASREHPEFKVTVQLAGEDEFTVRAVTTREGDFDLLGTGEDVDRWMMLPEGVGERTVRQAVTELRNGEIGMVAGTPDADPHARVQHSPDQTSWRPADPHSELLGTRAANEALVVRDEQGHEKRGVAGEGEGTVDVSMLMHAWGVDGQTARDEFVRGLMEPGGEQQTLDQRQQNETDYLATYEDHPDELLGPHDFEPSPEQVRQDMANGAYTAAAVKAAAGGRVEVFEPSWNRPGLSSVDLERDQGVPGTGSVVVGQVPTVTVSVDVDQQVHATIAEVNGREVGNATPAQVAEALDLDEGTAHQTVLEAAHELRRGQVAYDAVGDVDAAVAMFDRRHGQQATESLRWASEPTSQVELADAARHFPSDLAEARAVSDRRPGRRPDVQPPSAPGRSGPQPPSF